jgi:hypothetical protein
MKTIRETLTNLLGFLALFLMILYLTLRASPAPAATSEVEEWFIVLIDETPIGAVHATSGREGELDVETQEMKIVLNRMGSRIEMASAVETREDAAGRLRAVDSELVMSSQATRFRAVVEPGRVLISDQAGGESFAREIEYSGELLGPAGVRSLIRSELREIGDSVTYKTFRAELSNVAQISLELVGKEQLKRGGKSVEAWRLSETMAESPLRTSLWVDAEGRALRSATPSPFGLMETVGADAAAAQLAMQGGNLPEENYAATLAPTQVRLREPRAAERVVLELRHRSPDLGWPDMSAANQRVVEVTRDRVVLEVTRHRPSSRGAFPVESVEDSLRPYLEANAYLQSDAPEMRELARSIVGETDDVLTAGLALERWVAENMRFDMGVVMAPSSEVLENRRGTCTEYAVLLTTLARSLEIPSRFVMGYVYAGGIYGGHAWTEILVGDEWIALDGALVADGPADAGRFAFQWSSLEEGVGALNLGPGVQLFGQIELSVLEYEAGDGEVRTFPADAPLFTVDGNRYVNSALGLEWTKPSEFDFGELELTWPETLLVSLDGPRGERAELGVRDRYYWQSDEAAAREALRRALPAAELESTTVAGHPALVASGSERAAVAWVRGSELWMLTVDGEDASSALSDLARRLRL